MHFVCKSVFFQLLTAVTSQSFSRMFTALYLKAQGIYGLCHMSSELNYVAKSIGSVQGMWHSNMMLTPDFTQDVNTSLKETSVFINVDSLALKLKASANKYGNTPPWPTGN